MPSFDFVCEKLEAVFGECSVDANLQLGELYDELAANHPSERTVQKDGRPALDSLVDVVSGPASLDEPWEMEDYDNGDM
eukprot:5807245-Lingulodinium_polyedra.AAC.1